MRSMFLSQRDQQKEINLVKHDTKMKTKIQIQIFILIKIPKKFKPEKKNLQLGASLIKNLNDWEMSKKLKNTNVYLIHFEG